MAGLSSASLVRQIYPPLADEVVAIRKVLFLHCEMALAKGFRGENSTSFEDCNLLYVLARHFRRLSAFEIGTFIGTTAVAINEATCRNGGSTITCDPTDYGVLSPAGKIRFMRAPACVASDIIAR